MTIESYHLSMPNQLSSCLVFSSPHSGRTYSESFLDKTDLNNLQIRASEDAYVDDLFREVIEFGSPLLSAKAPRAFVDLNRSSDELDSAIIKDVKSNAVNPRIATGLGVIPRIVAEGKVIQTGKMELSEAHARLEEFYYPYHARLQNLLDDSQSRFGKTLLIDCHSMPHQATENMVVKGGVRPDVVLGDRFGASCSREVVDAIERAFLTNGFAVSRNVPFAGAYIMRTYGRPSKGQNAIQIELDRSLYMDEELVQKNEYYWDTKSRLNSVIKELTQIGKQTMPIAAE